MARGAASFECFDDDHASAAFGTGTGEDRRFVVRVLRMIALINPTPLFAAPKLSGLYGEVRFNSMQYSSQKSLKPLLKNGGPSSHLICVVVHAPLAP